MVDELDTSKLHRLRLQRGLSLREASKVVGLTKETLSELERGMRKPYPHTLLKLSEGYGVSIPDLLLPAGQPEEGEGDPAADTLPASESVTEESAGEQRETAGKLNRLSSEVGEEADVSRFRRALSAYGRDIALRASLLEGVTKRASRTGRVSSDLLSYVADELDGTDELLRDEVLPLLSKAMLFPGERGWLQTMDRDLGRLHQAAYELHKLAEEQEANLEARDDLAKKRVARATSLAERPRLVEAC